MQPQGIAIVDDTISKRAAQRWQQCSSSTAAVQERATDLVFVLRTVIERMTLKTGHTGMSGNSTKSHNTDAQNEGKAVDRGRELRRGLRHG